MFLPRNIPVALRYKKAGQRSARMILQNIFIILDHLSPTYCLCLKTIPFYIIPTPYLPTTHVSPYLVYFTMKDQICSKLKLTW